MKASGGVLQYKYILFVQNYVGIQCGNCFTLVTSLSVLPAKKLPKSEPQSTGGAVGRRGVDLHEQSQQNKSQCCSNWMVAFRQWEIRYNLHFYPTPPPLPSNNSIGTLGSRPFSWERRFTALLTLQKPSWDVCYHHPTESGDRPTGDLTSKNKLLFTLYYRCK